MSDEFQLLKAYGDPLEKAIAADHEGMEAVIYPYAGVWAEHVLSRRTDDHTDLKVPAWRPFACHHYTAVVRVYHAQQALREIRAAAGYMATHPHDWGALLRLHRELASFWENLGSAIDNLESACRQAPGVGWDPPRTEELKYAYDRRTQFVHSRLVPVSNVDGSIELNLSVFHTETTTWERARGKAEWVDRFHDDKWTKVRAELANLWQALRSKLAPSRPSSWSPSASLKFTDIPFVAPSGTYM